MTPSAVKNRRAFLEKRKIKEVWGKYRERDEVGPRNKRAGKKCSPSKRASTAVPHHYAVRRVDQARRDCSDWRERGDAD